MSSIRLLILGVLLRKQPIHGYEVRRELEQWHADKWANVAYGSIYSALGKMSEEGFVAAANSEQGERLSGKTEYMITESGKREFERLLREYWWELKPMIDPFQIALTFMDKLPPAELEAALRHRAGQLYTSIAQLERSQGQDEDSSSSVRLLHASTRLMLAHARTELHWIEEIICKIADGELP